MPMSDPVLAAIITATATICMSLLQLRFSLGKEGGGRSQTTSGGKRKGRGPFAVLFVIIIASAVGGFALSQWLTENERVSQSMREHELQDSVEKITRTANQLELTRSGARVLARRSPNNSPKAPAASNPSDSYSLRADMLSSPVNSTSFSNFSRLLQSSMSSRMTARERPLRRSAGRV